MDLHQEIEQYKATLRTLLPLVNEWEYPVEVAQAKETLGDTVVLNPAPEPGKRITLPTDDSLHMTVQSLFLARKQRDAASADAKQLKAIIESTMGEAAEIMFHDGSNVIRSRRHRASYQVKESTYDDLRVRWNGPPLV